MKKELQLANEAILLRPNRQNDIDRLYEAVRESIAEVSLWMAWCHPDYSPEESRDWVESRADAWEHGTEYDFVITDSSDGLFLGGCGLNKIDLDHRRANLGYWVRSGRTRRGVATMATRLLARFGFEQLGLNRIEIVTAVGNQASRRVAEKAGATQEGILRNRFIVRDNIYDAVMFSLIPGDLARSS